MRTLALSVVFVVATAVVAQDPAGKLVPKELAALAGHYKPQSVIFDGVEQMPTPESKAVITLWIKDGEYRLFVLKDAAKDLHYRLSTADIAIDAPTKTFTLTITQGQKKGEKMHGIYDHTSTQWKVCYGPAEKPRPTTFAAPKDSGLFLETWAPEKK